MATEGTGSGGGGGGGGGGGDETGDSAGLIWAWLHHDTFGVDGDYTGDAGYGGDNTGPPGSRSPDDSDIPTVAEPPPVPSPPPRQDEARRRDVESYAGSPVPLGDLHAYAGRDIDPFTGLALRHEDPFTGLPKDDPFLDAPISARWPEPAETLPRPKLFQSAWLLAENGPVVCNPARTSCLPETASDANQSSVTNQVREQIQLEMDESNAAALALQNGTARVLVDPRVDMQKLANDTVAQLQSDEHQLRFTVNQLHEHPIMVQHSAVAAGLSNMAWGTVSVAVAAGMDIGTDGFFIPMGGAMMMSSGAAQFGAGFTQLVSGADSTSTLQTGEQLDYVFSLNGSPAGFLFGLTGLVIGGGNVEMSHDFALVGGLVEGGMSIKPDMGKLNSGLPIIDLKPQPGQTTLLMKDVVDLGLRAKAPPIEVVAREATSKNMRLEEIMGAQAFQVVYDASGEARPSGIAAHEVSGAAGSGQGVDFPEYGGAVQTEVKYHGPFTSVQQFFLDNAEEQSLAYSVKSQLESRAAGEQRVPIRIVKHVFVNGNQTVQYVRAQNTIKLTMPGPLWWLAEP